MISMVLKYSLIFLLQLIFNVLKVEEIKYSYENKTSKLIFNSILMNAISLATTYYSLTLMLNGDWVVAAIYIAGAASGKWVATTKMFNYRKFILDELKKKD